MAFIRPFRGLRYNPQKISDLASVMSLPYDVLSSQDREELYQANPYNIVRLIWGKELPGDDEKENKYLRAARLLQEWEGKGVLIREESEAFYLYAQDFSLAGGEERSRRGIIARVRLEDLNSDTILRHESTFPVPKADRLNLLRTTQANLDPIFTLYEGGPGRGPRAIMDEGMRKPPLFDFRDREGVRHRLWAMKEPSDHAAIVREMAEQPLLFIADGHHRYEASLLYRQERMEREGGSSKEDSGCHYTMMVLVAMEDPGLVILPVHRLIGGIEGWDLKGFLKKAKEFFLVEEARLPSKEEERQRFISERLEKVKGRTHGFGLYAGGDSIFFLSLDEAKGNLLQEERIPEEIRRLDVTILDRLILEGLLGLLSPEQKEKVGFTPDLQEALHQVREGAYDLAFLLKPTSLSEVMSVSLAGGRMPQKSTYFHPKLLSGLVINRFDP
ncbi:MAG: DUF1015 domain-containing protein [bacterium]